MIRPLAAAAFLAAGACTSSPSRGAPCAPVLELRNGRWFDGRTFVRGDRWCVDGHLTAERPEGVRSIGRAIDLAGQWVVPAFGDAHVHLLEPDRAEEVVHHFLHRGVYYVRDQGNFPSTTRRWRAALERGPAFDLSCAQRAFTGPGGHPLELQAVLPHLGIVLPNEVSDQDLEVESEAEIAALWPSYLADGPDLMKLVLVHSELHAERRHGDEYFGRRGLDPALVDSLVRRARSAGLQVSAHTQSRADFRTAVDAGVDVLTHFPGSLIDPGVDPDSLLLTADDAQAAAARGVVVVTALSHLAGAPGPVSPDVRAHVQRVVRPNLELLRAAGVRLVLGSDGMRHTVDVEAAALAELGLFEPLELLRMLACETPRYLYPERRLGDLGEGAEASFLVLSADPLVDIAHIRRIALRVRGGQILLPRASSLPALTGGGA